MMQSRIQRTRVKMCGLTREEDVSAVIAAGADAIGFVFYPPSPRYVTPGRAAELARMVPPFVTLTGLFVNATVDDVLAVTGEVPLTLLQFHGDETPEVCARIAASAGLPFIRAARVGSATSASDLIKYEEDYRRASPLFRGLLLDTLVEQYGGSGKAFDWSIIPRELAPRVVLSGGLSVHNVTDAVMRVGPYAVDVSSGIEASRGIKDNEKIRAFMAAVTAVETAASPYSGT